MLKNGLPQQAASLKKPPIRRAEHQKPMPDKPSSSSSASSSDARRLDREFGDYRLLRRLGRGAMAEVFLAEQKSLKRKVAIKFLKPELARDEKYIRRFRNEAQAAASLVHANIVQIHEVGCYKGYHYIVQEYVAGVNLKQLLHRRGPLDLPLAISVMHQVAAALGKAGQAGIVHRDIKPENIMLSQAGEVKVADFGLARVHHEKVDLTQVGVTLGTPLYMSPEQVEGRVLDPRSDIYSFGVTCYEMLAGRPPFEADNALAVAVQHLQKEPPLLGELRSDLPSGLCQIVHKMLAKKPEQRYASAIELLRDLRALNLPESDPHEWPSVTLPAGDASQTTTASSQRPASAATQQLQAVMNAQTSRSRRAVRWLMPLGAVILGLVLGGGLSAQRRTSNLLAGAKAQRSAIPQQPTALAQYLFASNVRTAEAWQSVLRYFPEEANRYLGWRTKQQLARHYLARNELDKAMAYFDELAKLDQAERELVAFGLAGRCVVLSLQGRYRESAETLIELEPLRDAVPSDMQRLLAHAIQRNRRALGPQTAQDWDRWLEQQIDASLD